MVFVSRVLLGVVGVPRSPWLVWGRNIDVSKTAEEPSNFLFDIFRGFLVNDRFFFLLLDTVDLLVPTNGLM